MDINVTGVWQQNITGRGITVAVIDDGMRIQVIVLFSNIGERRTD